MRPLRGNQGFTLVELLLVVAILALISLMAVPKVHGAMVEARHAQMLKEIRVIQDSLERYYADHNQYPRRLGLLVDHGYLRTGTTFKSPVSGQVYFYAVDNNRDNRTAQAYILGDAGKNPRNDKVLPRSGAFPKPKPVGERAWAWLDSSNNNTALVLHTERGTPLPENEYPRNLGDYRDSCRGATPPPCDLWSN